MGGPDPLQSGICKPGYKPVSLEGTEGYMCVPEKQAASKPTYVNPPVKTAPLSASSVQKNLSPVETLSLIKELFGGQIPARLYNVKNPQTREFEPIETNTFEGKKIVLYWFVKVIRNITGDKGKSPYQLTSTTRQKIEADPALKAKLKILFTQNTNLQKFSAPIARHKRKDDPRIRFAFKDAAANIKLNNVVEFMRDGIFNLEVYYATDRDNQITDYVILSRTGNTPKLIAYYKNPPKDSDKSPIRYTSEASHDRAAIAYVQNLLEGSVSGLGPYEYNPGVFDPATSRALYNFLNTQKEPLRLNLDYEKTIINRKLDKAREMKSKLEIAMARKSNGSFKHHVSYRLEKAKATLRSYRDLLRYVENLKRQLPSGPKYDRTIKKCDLYEKVLKRLIVNLLYEILGVGESSQNLIESDFAKINISMKKYGQRRSVRRKREELARIIDGLVSLHNVLTEYEVVLDGNVSIKQKCKALLDRTKKLRDILLTDYIEKSRTVQSEMALLDPEYSELLSSFGKRKRENPHNINTRFALALHLSTVIGSGPTREVLTNFLYRTYRMKRKEVSLERLFLDFEKMVKGKSERALERLGRSSYKRGLLREMEGLEGEDLDEEAGQYDEAAGDTSDAIAEHFDEAKNGKRRERGFNGLFYSLYREVEFHNAWAKSPKGRKAGAKIVRFKDVARKLTEVVLPILRKHGKSLGLSGLALDKEIAKSLKPLTEISLDAATAEQELAALHNRELTRLAIKDWRIVKIKSRDQQQIQGISYEWHKYSIFGKGLKRPLKFSDIKGIQFINDKTAKVTYLDGKTATVKDYQIINGRLVSQFKFTDAGSNKASLDFSKIDSITFIEPPHINLDSAMKITPHMLGEMESKYAEKSIPLVAHSFASIERLDKEMADQIKAQDGKPAEYYLVSAKGRFQRVSQDDLKKLGISGTPPSNVIVDPIKRKVTEFLKKEKLAVLQMILAGRKVSSGILRLQRRGQVQGWLNSIDLTSLAELFAKGKYFFKPQTFNLKPIQRQVLTTLKNADSIFSEKERALLEKLVRSDIDRYFTDGERKGLEALVEKIGEKDLSGVLDPWARIVLKVTLPMLRVALAGMIHKEGYEKEESDTLKQMAKYMKQYGFKIYDAGLVSRVAPEEVRMGKIPAAKLKAFDECYARTISILEKTHAQLFFLASKNPNEEYDGDSILGRLATYYYRDGFKHGIAPEAMSQTIAAPSMQESQQQGMQETDTMLIRLLIQPKLIIGRSEKIKEMGLTQVEEEISKLNEKIKATLNRKENKEKLGIRKFQASYKRLEGLRELLAKTVKKAQAEWDAISDDTEYYESNPLRIHLGLLDSAKNVLMDITGKMKTGYDDPRLLLEWADDLHLMVSGLKNKLQKSLDENYDKNYGGVLAKLSQEIETAQAVLKQIIANRKEFAGHFDKRTDLEIRRDAIMAKLSSDEFSAEDYKRLMKKLPGFLKQDRWARFNRWLQSQFTGDMAKVYDQDLRDSGKTPFQILEEAFKNKDAKFNLRSSLPVAGQPFKSRTMVISALNRVIESIPREGKVSILSALPVLALSGRQRLASPFSKGIHIPNLAGHTGLLVHTFGPDNLVDFEKMSNSPAYMTYYNFLYWASSLTYGEHAPMNISFQFYSLIRNTRRGQEILRDRLVSFNGNTGMPLQTVNAKHVSALVAAVKEEILPKIANNPALRSRLQYLKNNAKIRAFWLDKPLEWEGFKVLNDEYGKKTSEIKLYDFNHASGEAERTLAILVQDLGVIMQELNKAQVDEDPENTPITFFDPREVLRVFYQIAKYGKNDPRAEEMAREIIVARYDGTTNDPDELKASDEYSTLGSIADSLTFNGGKDIYEWTDRSIANLARDIKNATKDSESFTDAIKRLGKGMAKGYGDAVARFTLLMHKQITMGWPNIANGLIDAIKGLSKGDKKTALDGLSALVKGLGHTVGAFFVFELFGFIFLDEVLTDIENGRYPEALTKLHYIYNRFLKGSQSRIWETVMTARSRGWINLQWTTGKVFKVTFNEGGREALRKWQIKRAIAEFGKGGRLAVREWKKERAKMGFRGLGIQGLWKTSLGLPEIPLDIAAWVDRFVTRKTNSLTADVSESKFRVRRVSSFRPTSVTSKPLSTVFEFSKDGLRVISDGINDVQQDIYDGINNRLRRLVERIGSTPASSPISDAKVMEARLKLVSAALNAQSEFKLGFKRGSQEWGSIVLDRNTYLKLCKVGENDVAETRKIIEEFNRRSGGKYTHAIGSIKELHSSLSADRAAYRLESELVESLSRSTKASRANTLRGILRGLSGRAFFLEYEFTLPESGRTLRVRGWQIARMILDQPSGIDPQNVTELMTELGKRIDGHEMVQEAKRAGRAAHRYSAADILKGYGIKVSHPERFEGIKPKKLMAFCEKAAIKGVQEINIDANVSGKGANILQRLETLLDWNFNKGSINKKSFLDITDKKTSKAIRRALLREGYIDKTGRATLSFNGNDFQPEHPLLKQHRDAVADKLRQAQELQGSKRTLDVSKGKALVGKKAWFNRIDVDVTNSYEMQTRKLSLNLTPKKVFFGTVKAGATSFLLSGILATIAAAAEGKDLENPEERLRLYKTIGIGTGIGMGFMGFDKALQLVGCSPVKSMGIAGALIGTGTSVYSNWDRITSGGWATARGLLNVGAEGGKGLASGVAFAVGASRGGTPGGLLASTATNLGLSWIENQIAESPLYMDQNGRLVTYKEFFDKEELTEYFSDKGIQLELKGSIPDPYMKKHTNIMNMATLLNKHENYQKVLKQSGITKITAGNASDLNLAVMLEIVQSATQFKAKHGAGKGIKINISPVKVRSFEEGKMAEYNITVSNGTKKETRKVATPLEGDPVKLEHRRFIEDNAKKVKLVDLVPLKVGIKYSDLKRYPLIRKSLDMVLPAGKGSYEERVNKFLGKGSTRDYFDNDAQRLGTKPGYLSSVEAYALLNRQEREAALKKAAALSSKKTGTTTVESSSKEIARELRRLEGSFERISQSRGVSLIVPKPGVYDQDIASIQRGLYKLGLMPKDKADGFYNDATDKALVEFAGKIHHPFNNKNIDKGLVKYLAKALELKYSGKDWRKEQIVPSHAPKKHVMLPNGRMIEVVTKKLPNGKTTEVMAPPPKKVVIPEEKDPWGKELREDYGIRSFKFDANLGFDPKDYNNKQSYHLRESIKMVLDRYGSDSRYPTSFDEIKILARKGSRFKIQLSGYEHQKSTGKRIKRDLVWFVYASDTTSALLKCEFEGYRRYDLYSSRRLQEVTNF